MLPPQPPLLKKLERLTPSLYEAILRCKARAAWYAFGERNFLPQHPSALLGICFHKVLELAHKGKLPRSRAECSAEARLQFEEEAKAQYQRVHPLVREKFSSPKKLPYYNLLRERATLRAVQVATKVILPSPPTSFTKGKQENPSGLVETTLFSSDGLLKGRSDYIDITNAEVFDYKSGLGAGKYDSNLSDAEIRQLRFYVHLGLENGLQLSKGTVIRSNGHRASIEISQEDAYAEAQYARTLLREFNVAVEQGKTFEEIAEPSVANCYRCPCIPFCEAFWANAKSEWAEQSGIHLEAEIIDITESSMQAATLLTFTLFVRRGTVSTGTAIVQQVPESWLLLERTERPLVGDILRITDGELASSGNVPRIRVDRISTTIWQVEEEQFHPYENGR